MEPNRVADRNGNGCQWWRLRVRRQSYTMTQVRQADTAGMI